VLAQGNGYDCGVYATVWGVMEVLGVREALHHIVNPVTTEKFRKKLAYSLGTDSFDHFLELFDFSTTRNSLVAS